MDESGEVAAVVDDHVGVLSVWEGTEDFFHAPVKLSHRFAFPGEYGNTGRSDTDKKKGVRSSMVKR